MKLLVTGADGFLGSEVVRQAVAAGHTVRPMVRTLDRPRDLPVPREALAECDLANLEGELDWVMRGIEGVIHCAAVTSASGGGEALSRRVNIEGTRKLLEAARRAGVRRWVQISSMSAHSGSTSVYGRTKLAADDVLRRGQLGALPAWTILRPSLIYGPGEKGLVAKTLGMARKLPVLPMLGSGRELLRPVYVGDVALGALRCLELDQVRGQTYIIGGADEVSLDTFMRRLLRAAGVRRPMVHLPLPICMGLARFLSIFFKNPPITVDNVLGVKEGVETDHSRAIREWGWNPIGLDEGLKQTCPARGAA